VPGALNLARDNFAHDYRHLDSVLKEAQDKPIMFTAAVAIATTAAS
jgi:hypothetical protein